MLSDSRTEKKQFRLATNALILAKNSQLSLILSPFPHQLTLSKMLLFRPSLLLTISYQHWHSTTGATLGAASGTANSLGLLSTSSLDVLAV